MTPGTPLKRWYEVTCETLTPLHISLGPEALLIPDEECDADGDRTHVLDREALIADFQARPPGPSAPAPPSPPPPARRRLTYRDVLSNRDHPDYARVRQEYQLASRLGLVTLDTPLDDEEEPTPVAAPPAPPAPAARDWTSLALTRPRDLPVADKRWRAADGGRLVRYELAGTPRVPGQQDWWASVSRLPRTPDGHILIPGSSLKGALRSLLAYAMAERVGTLPQVTPRSERDRWAAAPLEHLTLAPRAPRNERGGLRDVPNHDAGRLLLPRDAALESSTLARITAFGVQGRSGFRTFSGGGTREAFGAVEAVPAGVTFRARLAIDLALLERWGEVFSTLRPVLTADLAPLLAAGRAYAAAQLAADAAFYRELGRVPTAEVVAGLERRLAGLAPHETLLRLGWGTGKAGKAPFALLLRRSLPRSRRLSHGDDERPDQPFGWLRCAVTPLPES